MEPTATIVIPAHLSPAKRTTNRPADVAMMDFRLVPVETTTRSPDLKPRPLTASGLVLMTVSVARAADASRCDGSPLPQAINTKARATINTVPKA